MRPSLTGASTPARDLVHQAAWDTAAANGGVATRKAITANAEHLGSSTRDGAIGVLERADKQGQYRVRQPPSGHDVPAPPDDPSDRPQRSST